MPLLFFIHFLRMQPSKSTRWSQHGASRSDPSQPKRETGRVHVFCSSLALFPKNYLRLQCAGSVFCFLSLLYKAQKLFKKIKGLLYVGVCFRRAWRASFGLSMPWDEGIYKPPAGHWNALLYPTPPREYTKLDETQGMSCCGVFRVFQNGHLLIRCVLFLLFPPKNSIPVPRCSVRPRTVHWLRNI